MRTLAERFWEKVEKSAGCWLWTANRDPRPGYDYGRFRIGGKKERAHRVAWELTFGPIPDGLWVLHHCDVAACVRPDHLFLGDNSKNQADAVSKGRHGHLSDPEWRAENMVGHPGVRGERNTSARLTEDQVRGIRDSTEPQRVLGNRYGVSGVAIHKIRTRKTWAYLI